MRKLVLSALLSALCCAPVFAEEAAPADPAAPYKAAIKDFADSLKAELEKGMKEGGPLAAIAICSNKAQEITEQYSQKYALEISRTSLKLRNPQNAPSAHVKALLEKWAAEGKRGEALATLGDLQTIEIDGKQKHVFVKAIGVAKACTSCHGGAEVSAEVTQKLKALYPDDQARDYKEGDLRGAFVVVADVAEAK